MELDINKLLNSEIKKLLIGKLLKVDIKKMIKYVLVLTLVIAMFVAYSVISEKLSLIIEQLEWLSMPLVN